MAIVTGNYKGFTFGDISSKAYGVYITQEAAYDAPERDTEVVEIAGRNGAYILDNGRFKNITVSYKCGIALDSEGDFESAIRAFRNALSAKAGKYVRLEDEYNPNEFRQAAFLGGIDVNMADRRAGEFTVSFDAKPQRFLKSGETAVSVASGGTITNPTLFEASPLLHVWGYGDIGINGEDLSIINDEYGDVLLANKTSKSATSALSFLDESAVLMLNEDDDVFALAGSSVAFPLVLISGSVNRNITSVSITNSTPYEIPMEYSYSISGARVAVSVSLPQLNFAFNQTTQHLRSNINVTINYTDSGVPKTSTNECQIHAQYNCDPAGRYRVSLFYRDVTIDKFYNPNEAEMTIQPVYGVSTKRPFADDADFYFDLDIGEAYKIEDGQTISVNNAVTIPAELPKLASGANTITYDNTITRVDVTPRWWEV